jgi:pilus assembly protein CpaF
MTMFSESLRAFLKPVASYLEDDSISEIMINGTDDVWIERSGQLIKTDAKFTEEGLIAAARNVAQSVGRLLWEDKPQLDARLPDGSRIHIVLPPIARRGVAMAIRKFPKERLTLDRLLGLKALTLPMARLIGAAIEMKLNIVVSGGTGSGKTTLLNVFSSMIPESERVVTIEDSAELQLQHKHLVSLESRAPDKSGRGGIDMGDLLLSALRLRPDRIVVGEIRGPECFHFIQALNTGHGGSMSTCHANAPVDTLRRLESLALMAAVNLPLVAVRAQIASAIDLIICCARFPGGARKVTAISEVLPLAESGEYRVLDLFVHVPIDREPDGTLVGYHAPTGILPHFAADEARAFGFSDLADQFFDPATYDVPAPPPPPFRTGDALPVRWAPSLKHREKGLSDPDWMKEKRSTWEDKLRAEAAGKPRDAAPVPAARNGADARSATPGESSKPVGSSPAAAEPAAPDSPPATGQLLASTSALGTASSLSLDLEVSRESSPPFAWSPAGGNSKVELSPELVAELKNLGVEMENTPPPRPARAEPTAPTQTAKEQP